MANVKRIDGKTGVSYKITVTAGRGLDGKQIRHYKTYTPPQTWGEKKQAKEAEKVALDFERSIQQGYELDNRRTFAEYAEYVLQLKESTGVKPRTIETYRFLLKRINGAIGAVRLVDIRAQTLNSFYKALAKENVRLDGKSAAAKKDIAAILKERKMTKAALAETAGVAASTVTTVCQMKRVRLDKAAAIAKALSFKVNELFEVGADSSPLATKTVLEYHRLISTILSQAEKEMLVPYNAASKATPPQHKTKAPEYLQPDELRKILDALDSEPLKMRTMAHMLIVTGARSGEVCGMKWSNVDFNSSCITIDSQLLYTAKRGIFEGTTKTGETRTLKLPAETMELLRKYRHEYTAQKLLMGECWQDSGYLFVNDMGKPLHPHTLPGWLKSFAARHGLPNLHPHMFRHSAASILIASGIDLTTVAAQLGHANSSTTATIYSHLIEQAQAKASDCIAETLLRKQII